MAGVAIFFSIIFWIGLRFLPTVVIWWSIFLAFALFVTIGIVFLYNGGALTVSDEQGRLGIPTTVDRNFYNYYGGFTLFFASVVVLICFCCFYHIYPTV